MWLDEGKTVSEVSCSRTQYTSTVTGGQNSEVCSQWKSLESAKTLNTVRNEPFYLCGGLWKFSDHKFCRTMSCENLFFDMPVSFVTRFILCRKIFGIINTIPFRIMCHPSVCKKYRHYYSVNVGLFMLHFKTEVLSPCTLTTRSSQLSWLWLLCHNEVE